MRILLFCGLFLFYSSVEAQKYSFIKYSQNRIYMLDKKAMNTFFTALQGLEKGQKRKVNVVHIGDSHIQADAFSGRVRELLQKDPRFGNGGIGFVFPYTAAKTNNPKSYKSSFSGEWEGRRCVIESAYSRWGLAGITASTTQAKSSVTIQSVRPQDSFKITKVKIFYPVFDKSSFKAVVQGWSNWSSVSLSRDGYIEYELKKPQSQVTVKLNKSSDEQTKIVLQGMVLENDEKGIVYHSIGVNGAKSDSYFRCPDFMQQLKGLQADLVIISLGANDAFYADFKASQYKTNLQELVADIRKVAPKASILFTTPGDAYSRRRPNPENGNARQKIYELADPLNAAIWDLYEIMGGFRSIEQWQRQGLSQWDKLHLTDKGYALQGELLFEALMKGYSEF
jgi:lysophospholipase L1-like esterase